MKIETLRSRIETFLQGKRGYKVHMKLRHEYDGRHKSTFQDGVDVIRTIKLGNIENTIITTFQENGVGVTKTGSCRIPAGLGDARTYTSRLNGAIMDMHELAIGLGYNITYTKE